MKVVEQVQNLIDKINDGNLNKYAVDLDETDLGLYIPIYSEGDTLKILPDGYSQTESDLKITFGKKLEGLDNKAQSVAWIGDPAAKDSKCLHGKTRDCTHCTGHTGACHHCKRHDAKFMPDFGLDRPFQGLDVPELDYDRAITTFKSKQDVLKSLAKEGFGLALLHGHNDIHKFTQLPKGYLSVISNGVTHFRTADEVAKDATFVPNIWRVVDGALQPAGGFSQI